MAKSPRQGSVAAAATPDRTRRLGPALALALVLLLAGVLAWRQAPEVDFGFHLASGRYILEHRAWPRTDPFTSPVPDAPYTDMNGLFQVLLALLFGATGDVGAGLLVLAFVLGTTVVLWIDARRRGVVSPAILLLGFGLGLLAAEMRFVPRPELVSCLLLALLLHVLRRHAESGRAAWLWAVPPLQLVWVYAHSVSLLGLAVTGAYAALSLFARRRRGWAPWAALGGSAVALFLNPYGWRGVEFLWQLRTRMAAGNIFAEQINELKSPWSAEVHNIWPVLAFKVALGLAVLLLLSRLSRRSAFDVTVVAAFAVLGSTAVRNTSFFVVAALPVALQAAQELRDALARRVKPGRGQTILARAAPLAAALGVAFVAAQVVLGGYYVADMRPERFGAGLSPAIAPRGCVDFLVREGTPGPIFNELRFGGYLLGRLWPRQKVFIDGRLEVIGEAFYQQYREILAGPGWAAMVQRYDPNVALVATTSRELVQQLASDREWAPVEVDGASVLFLRRRPGAASLVAAAAERFAALERAGGPDDAPLAPRPEGSWIARLLAPRRYPWEARGRGNAFMLLGLNSAARKDYRRALVEAGRDDPTLALNFASANFRLGRRDEARVWYRRVLDFDPANRLARERLAALAGPGADQR